MHSVLLIIEKPTAPSLAETQAWGRIQTKISEQLNLYEGMKKINESSLEIPLNNSMPAFVNVLHVVQVEPFPYQVLFFEEEPQWIQYPFQQQRFDL
jgi:hypothetical protein